MPAVSFFCGLLIGTLQIILTGKIADSILLPGEKNPNAALILVIKLALYAGAICLVLFAKKCSPLWAGVGYGVGMVAGCAVYLITKKASASGKKPDEPHETERSDINENN